MHTNCHEQGSYDLSPQPLATPKTIKNNKFNHNHMNYSYQLPKDQVFYHLCWKIES